MSQQLAAALAAAGYAVDRAADGERADFLARTESYDAVVLDLGLPRIAHFPSRCMRGSRRRSRCSPAHSAWPPACCRCTAGSRRSDTCGRGCPGASGAAPAGGRRIPCEIQPLVNDLNALLEHRERAVQRAVTKAGDLAHGLKTPLTILAQEAERANVAGHAEVADAIRQQVDRMRKQVDYHLRSRARCGIGRGGRDAMLDPGIG